MNVQMDNCRREAEGRYCVLGTLIYSRGYDFRLHLYFSVLSYVDKAGSRISTFLLGNAIAATQISTQVQVEVVLLKETPNYFK